ncbi:MAG: hypothetical protein OXD37_06245 [Acidimicrobiaceae bacterium]|nr:hypothetical protein [Acidimicrobiaceae bacterium]
MKHATRRIGDTEHHFVLVTEGRDLLEEEALEALYEAGCTDASIGHRVVEFDRAAPTRWEAIRVAIHDVSSVAGVKVVDVRDSLDALCDNRTEPTLA